MLLSTLVLLYWCIQYYVVSCSCPPLRYLCDACVLCMCVCLCNVYVLIRNYFKDFIQYTWINESREAQPEKNVITDLADFIYLINHRLAVLLLLVVENDGYCYFFMCVCVCPTLVGDDFMLQYAQTCPYKISIEPILDVCASIFQHNKKSHTYTKFYVHTFSWLCEWKCQLKSSTICFFNSRWKERIIKYSKHNAAAAAAYVLSLRLW